MFVLRRLTSQNVERNTILGDSYVLIDGERNPEDYAKSINKMKCNPDDVFGFISHNEGQSLIPLYRKSKYFVMSSNGQTFANLTKLL